MDLFTSKVLEAKIVPWINEVSTESAENEWNNFGSIRQQRSHILLSQRYLVWRITLLRKIRQRRKVKWNWPNAFFLVVIKYNDLICLRGLRVYFRFQSQVTVQHWVKSVWKLQTATNITYTIKNRENLMHTCLLACFLVLNSIFPLIHSTGLTAKKMVSFIVNCVFPHQVT